jgi:anaerobic selenocysteine-containing dehydrogenase
MDVPQHPASAGYAEEIAKDPARCLIVVDPRRTETAELADIHLQVKPGTDAWLLAAMLGVLVQEKLIAGEWLALHANGLGEVLPHFAGLPIAKYCEACGVPEELARQAARRIASAACAASFEDLGVQMNRHSTLVSYLHKLLMLLTGNFGKKGSSYIPTMMAPFTVGHEGGAGTEVISPGDQQNSGMHA